MSQVVASRYAEMAASPDFRDLGAPSLTNTAPTPHQRDVRNMIVAKILEDYAVSGTGPVEAMLVDPSATMGDVTGPRALHLTDVPMPPPAGGRRSHRSDEHAGSAASAGAHHAPGDEAARVAIARGAAEVAGEDAAAKARFGSAQRKADEQDTKTNREVGQ